MVDRRSLIGDCGPEIGTESGDRRSEIGDWRLEICSSPTRHVELGDERERHRIRVAQDLSLLSAWNEE